VASLFKRGGKRNRYGHYVVAYFDETGKRRTCSTRTSDRAAAELIAQKIEAEIALRRRDIIDARQDRFAAEAKRPLTAHLDDWKAALLAKGVAPKTAALVRTRAAKVAELCKADRIAGLTPSAVQHALAAIRDAGRSLATCNHTLRAIKQFTRWLCRDGRVAFDALQHLTGYNARLDRRHDRRALSDDELARLIAAAEYGPPVLGMAGHDRAMLYRLAVGTGFRAGELASLTPESFNLDGDPPTVTVQAAYSKHRRQDVQPIRADLAETLRPWLALKAAGLPVFVMARKPGEMMRVDLATARAAWIDEASTAAERAEREASDFLAYRDSAGLFADFHSLRHTYISRLVQSGATAKIAQALARHSTVTLTLDRYAHVGLHDEAAALAGLPALPAMPTRRDDRQRLRATGTDDARPDVADCDAGAQQKRQQLAQTQGHFLPSSGIMGNVENCENPLENEQNGTTCHYPPSSDVRVRKPLLYPAELRPRAVRRGERKSAGLRRPGARPQDSIRKRRPEQSGGTFALGREAYAHGRNECFGAAGRLSVVPSAGILARDRSTFYRAAVGCVWDGVTLRSLSSASHLASVSLSFCLAARSNACCPSCTAWALAASRSAGLDSVSLSLR